MASESTISLLKQMFTEFFSSFARPPKQEALGYGKQYKLSPAERWAAYKKKSKNLIYSYSATVTSLSGTIGQEGVNAFNAWVAIYATPSSPDELSSTAVADLKKWYDKYLASLK